jgi:hypothetical protein
MTPTQPTSSKSPRRWFQYSLRTLLIFVTLFAVACSWFAVKLGQARRQREAVEALFILGYNAVIMKIESMLQHLVNVGGCRHALG